MDYSIVATTFNDEKIIQQYLDNILQQKKLPKEIVIADGGSKDKTIKILENYKERCIIPMIIIHGKRLNISEGYNEAIKACTTNYIGITGIGNYYAQDFFELLCGRMQDCNADITFSPIRGRNNNQFSCLYNKTFLNSDNGIILKIASNRGALVKKCIFDNLGLFYEKFVYAGEDTEFYMTALKWGYKLICVNDAYFYWDTPQSVKEYCKQVKNYTVGNMQIESNSSFLKKYRGRGIRLLVLLVLLILFILNIENAASYLVLFGIFLLVIIKKRKEGLDSFLLKQAGLYLPLYYILRYSKYLKTEYKVPGRFPKV